MRAGARPAIHSPTMSQADLLMFIAVALVLVGMAGTIMPALPGTPLVFAGLVCGAWAHDFEKVGWVTLTILGLLTVASLGIDYVGTAMGAKRVGASKLAVFLAALGALAGLVFGLPGVIIGPFVGAFAGELLARRSGDWKQAGKVGLGTWVGLALATAGKLALTFAMLGIFSLAYAF